MKRITLTLLLSLCLILTAYGQKHASSRIGHLNSPSTVSDRIPVGFQIDQNLGLPDSRLKSSMTYTHKMDSMLQKRYYQDSAGLRPVNQGWYKYDSKGRVIENILYTCNTWNDEYAWTKDSTTWYADGKPSYTASYDRTLATDPWAIYSWQRIFYDRQGNDTTTILNDKNFETGVWVTSRENKSFDQGNLCLLKRAEIWDSVTGSWVNYYKSENTWDSGLLMAQDSYRWDPESGSWMESDHGEYSYDTNRNQTSAAGYYYSETDKTWQGSFRQEAAFNSQGLQTLSIYYGWDWLNHCWVPQTRWTQEFNAAGQSTDYAYYYWDTSSNTYTPVSRTTGTYDAAGYAKESLSYSWDNEKGEWIVLGKTTWEYDTNGNKILEVIYSPGTASGSWNEYYRTEYTYDSDNEVTRIFYLMAKDETFGWLQKLDVSYTYDHGLPFRNTFSPMVWTMDEPVWMLVNVAAKRWTFLEGVWTDQLTADYWYSPFEASGLPSEILEESRVYPNPAGEFVMVEMGSGVGPGQFSLVDINGRCVRSNILFDGQSQISLAGLKEGLYLYRLTRNGLTVSGKILKK